MSTIGSSAASLATVVGVLSNFGQSGSSTTDSGRGPANIANRDNALATRRGPTVATSGDEPARRPDTGSLLPNLNRAVETTLARQRDAASEAKKNFLERAERIADLVDRFEESAGRIQAFLRTENLSGPAGPLDLSRRVGRQQRDSTSDSSTENARSHEPNPIPNEPTQRDIAGKALDTIA